jgi:inositol transport system ATP-binding protein
MVLRTGMESYRLEVKNITKSFPGVLALSDVSLKVRAGSVCVLCGENGAGKSTLMKIIDGIYQPDRGDIFIDGKKVYIKNPIQARALGISMIFQELNYIPELTLEENLFCGKLPIRHGHIDWRAVRSQTIELLKQENLPYSPTMKMKNLTVSDIQMLEILKAISIDARIIIMDEPTSAISEREVNSLFEKIEDLKKRGKSIIYISHKMDEIFRIADDIVVLRDGKVVDARPQKDFTIDEVISLMVGRKLEGNFPVRTSSIGEEALSIRNLSGGKFKNITFSVRRGEIVGFAGLMGSGRTEIMRAIFGLDPYRSGEILVSGKLTKIDTPRSAIKAGIAMLSEDRRRFGIVPVRNIKENVGLTNLSRFFYRGYLHASVEKSVVSDISSRMNIKAPSLMTTVEELSGGNQQKIVLGKWVLSEAHILILDEPTRGIDVGSKFEIYKLMNALAAEGKALIMVSSELPELIGMCDRIYVIYKGEIAGELQKAEYSQEAIMRLATGYENKMRVNP